MYRKQQREQREFEDFHLSFGGRLSSDNRWVHLAKLIPWEQIEVRYAANFQSRTGPPALIARIAVGSLIIKEKLQLSDDETVEQIRENPYLQYFLGYKAFSDDRPFDPSMLVHFRKRISGEILSEINDLILATQSEDTDDDSDGGPPDDRQPNDEPEGDGEAENDGTLLMDATCVPAAIHYPTDLSLLNDAREMTETIIDTCHAPDVGTKEKPRTYRRKARKQYLSVAKKKKPRVKAIRRALRQQLQYIRRNLETIRSQYGSDLTRLSRHQYRSLLVVSEVYRQQRKMYDEKTHSVPGRIVSLSQPHVRPIVRGKTAAPVEFGAKISAAKVGDFAYLDRLSWDAYNESGDLPRHVDAYRRRFGHYPKTIQADAIYRTRENRHYCKERGIRLGGPPLGRPKKNPTRAERHQARDDERARIPIEGVFGRGKTRYSLSRIMAKRRDTSETTIALAFLVMNLDTLLRQLSLALFRILMWLFGYRTRRLLIHQIRA
ncbi:MAG: IS5 family transposase [Spirochaeta sp.]|nr:IS5 family transposase [Spirochaeta sp.]